MEAISDSESNSDLFFFVVLFFPFGFLVHSLLFSPGFVKICLLSLCVYVTTSAGLRVRRKHVIDSLIILDIQMPLIIRCVDKNIQFIT